jgi:hypothetical protein
MEPNTYYWQRAADHSLPSAQILCRSHLFLNINETFFNQAGHQTASCAD